MAIVPGVYSTIEDRTFAAPAPFSLSSATLITANRGASSIKFISSAREFIDEYGVPNRDNPSMYAALRYLRRVGGLYVRRVINDAVAATGVSERASTTELTVTAASEGVWGNSIKVTFGSDTNLPEGVFTVSVTDGNIVEDFEVSRDVDAKNGFGRSVYIEDVINRRSNLIRVTDTPNGEDDYEASEITLSGGLNDTVAPTSAMLVSAVDEFKSVEDFDFLTLFSSGWTDVSVQQAMVDVCATRKVSVAILDVPENTVTDPSAMVAFRNTELGVDSYFGALYGGWIRIQDEYNDREVSIPTSGDAAAVIIRTVSEFGYQEPPFGLEKGTIPRTLGTSIRFDEAQLKLVSAAGINPVTKIGLASAVIWGQRTLQKAATGFDRLNVVLNVLYTNEQIRRILLPYVGRPNTPLNRESANAAVTRFLEGRKRIGALTDYFVDTSDAINTPEVIDSQTFNIDSYIQPVRGMEFINQRTIVTPTGVTLS